MVDGDTVDVRDGAGRQERVRVVGIDTPETGECGFERASAAMADLVMDRPVVLTAGARDDRDRYGRILRYVDVDGTDAGLSLIRRGLAIARYDSRDGYGRHPREDAYVAADAAAPDVTCGAPSPSPPSSSPPPSSAAPSSPASAPPPPASSAPSSANGWGSSSCDPAYDPCVPPVAEVGDLDCADIRTHYPDGVTVDRSHGDPHRLDGDEDGRGCE